MSPVPYLAFKKPSGRKSLCKFNEVLDVKHKTAVQRLGAVKSKRKDIKVLSMLWYIITNSHVHDIINYWVKKSLYS